MQFVKLYIGCVLCILNSVCVFMYRLNPVGGDIFRTRPDRPWDSPSLLYNGLAGLSLG
jgi:hypothetical protein